MASSRTLVFELCSASNHTFSFFRFLFLCVNHSLSWSSLCYSLYHNLVPFIAHTSWHCPYFYAKFVPLYLTLILSLSCYVFIPKFGILSILRYNTLLFIHLSYIHDPFITFVISTEEGIFVDPFFLSKGRGYFRPPFYHILGGFGQLVCRR